MTAQCLNAADREYERPGGIAHVRAQCDLFHHVEAESHLAAGDDPDLVALVDAEQTVVYERQSLVQIAADEILEFGRRGPGTTLGTVHGDEVRLDAGFQHGLANAHEFVALA